MWGFWGRELTGRPALRGWLNNQNFQALGSIAENVVDYLPFNPKTAAFVSRLAATDFDLENVDEDPVFGGIFRKMGIEEFDVGGALFLPAGGENPFLVMVPGLGLIPTALAHVVFDKTAPDPIEDPQGYQAYLRQWGQFFPGMHYNRPHGFNDTVVKSIFGGGVYNRFEQIGRSADLLFFPDAAVDQSAIAGDWKLNMQYLRGVQEAFGQQGALEAIITELNELPQVTPEAIEAIVNEQLSGVAADAAKQHGLPLLTENLGEFLVPARIEAVDQVQDLREVWVNGLEAGLFPGLDGRRFDLNSAEGRRKAADSIRSHFFQLTDLERDILVVENPQLAVNMVSMWEKTDLGKQVLGEEVYRSGGSDLARDRHATWIELGYIKPKDPREFAIEIIGVQGLAQQNLAGDLYEDMATNINDSRWDYFLEKADRQTLSTFKAVYDYVQEYDLLPWTDEKDVWTNYSKAVDELVEHAIATDPPPGWDELGREKQEMARDKIRSYFGIPTKFKSWGITLPSDMSAMRDELEFGFPVYEELIDEDIMRRADALGIEIEPEMEFSNFYQQIADYRANGYLENPLYVEVMNEFQAIRTPRSAGRQTFEQVLGTVVDEGRIDPDSRTYYRQSLLYLDEAERLRSRYGSDHPAWMELRDKGLDRLGRMKQDPVLRKLDIEGLYNEAYGRNLGDWDWMPDEPAPLLTGVKNEAGYEMLNENATRVYLRQVVDGDTIVVSNDYNSNPLRQTERPYAVRLLGVNARELAEDGGDDDMDRLQDALEDAMAQGLPIYVVRDPERYSNTDFYGRQFSWLYIGEEPFYFPETMRPER
jgi:hypothetical protein